MLIEHDPFFNRLGRGGIRDRADGTVFTEPDSGLIADCGELLDRLEVLACTVNFDFMGTLSAGKRPDGGLRIYTHWNFESLFGGAREAGESWPPVSEVPPDLPECPPKKESIESQIFSGESVSLDGIYEPWLPTGAIGCPNYLLKGSIAHKYRMEQTDELLQVRWRMLWQDTRYINGEVTAEEASYVWPVVSNDDSKLGAYAGETCPKTGRWQAFRLSNRVEFVQKGKQMPGPDRTPTGLVHWHFLDEGSSC